MEPLPGLALALIAVLTLQVAARSALARRSPPDGWARFRGLARVRAYPGRAARVIDPTTLIRTLKHQEATVERT